MIEDQLIEKEEIKRQKEKLYDQQKKFKSIEQDKKYFTDEAINIIKKQKMTMEKLKKENEALKELVAKVNNQRTISNNNGMSYEHLKDLIADINMAIQTQKQAQKNIDTHIANFQNKIIEKKKNCLGMNSGTQSEKNLQKQIKILENRLDKANQKFNETIAFNKDLKSVIDSLRRERVIFDNLYQKLQKELHEKRKKMANIIEKANNAYQERDKANNQVQALKQHAHKQANQFQKQIKEMGYLLEKVKLSNFARNTTIKSQQFPNYYEHEEPVAEMKSIKQTKKGSEQMDKVQKFREDFQKIQAATEIKNFDKLLRIFSENQQKNFQMFKFVNLQSNEIEELQFQVGKLRDQFQLQKPSSTGEAKDRLISDLENRLKTVNAELYISETKFHKDQKEAKTICTLIEKIFQTIDCDREVAKEVGGSKTISETNLLVFLAIIEHKAIQIVSTYKQLVNSNMISIGPKLNVPPPCILSFEDFEDNEEYDKILTADELRRKATDFILKEQGQKQKKKDNRLKKSDKRTFNNPRFLIFYKDYDY